MTTTALFFLSFALSMDAFAVSVCKGLALTGRSLSDALKVGVWFGLFQGCMPLIGYFFAAIFHTRIDAFDHYVSFFILFAIGIGFIKSGLKKNQTFDYSTSLGAKEMFPLALATSIDALAAGVPFSMENTRPPYGAFCVIGIFTLILCTFGAYLGNRFGEKYQSRARILGGIVLLVLSLKLLLEGIFKK